MKMVTFFSALALTFAIASTASASSEGVVKSILCINSEMSSEEIKEASALFLGMKIGDTVSLDEVREYALAENGVPREGMGIVETSSKIALVMKEEGFCQKDKTVTAADGSEKIVSIVGTVVLTISK